MAGFPVRPGGKMKKDKQKLPVEHRIKAEVTLCFYGKGQDPATTEPQEKQIYQMDRFTGKVKKV